MEAAPTTLVVARHGETDWNREGRFQGHADPPLNALGRKQAAELAELLAGRGLAALYASDLRRAAETAELVGRRLRLEVVLHAGLREIDVGAWSGLTRDEIIERFPGQWDDWRAGTIVARGGEPREVFQQRVVGAVLEIAASHPGERIGIVAHGGVVRSLQRHVLGEALAVIENGGTWQLAAAGGALYAHT